MVSVLKSVTFLFNYFIFHFQTCPVILFLFGTVGNILILFMLRTLRLGRTSMHVFLRALAVSDLCVLYTGLLRWWMVWSFGVDLRNQHTLLCKVHTWMVYVALYVSAWLLVFMTLERTCSACLPHRVNTFCTKRRACFLIAFIVIFQVCMQSHFLFGMTLAENNDTGEFNKSGKFNDSRKLTCLEISQEYHFFIHNVYPLVDLVLLSLIPFILVILGNVVIIWKTFLSLRTAARLNLTSNKSANLRRRRASSMTIILVCLSALFLLTTSPTCVFNMWERGVGGPDAMVAAMGSAKYELVWAIVSIVMYCNNTFNFYLYCLSGRKFRNEIRRQFSRRRTDSQSVVFSAPSLQLHRFQRPSLVKGYIAHSNNGKESDDLCSHVNDNCNGFLLYRASYFCRNDNAYL
ncbi:unnamed protein product [Candidula unifasciata]|uniref:G-protein coupled receptors family 1 profile domain-containing protein n=1 Tax=Candidula unifasciata TaxID=100452 RepID=A0A8S3ZXP8_9EUPU|nr:unnamed protein product [Candidula unifasciata]